MSEELMDEQSHYEISLTAGQAFVAFVLLLLSLAASFAFGLMIGKGQGDDRLVIRKEPAVVTEASVVPRKAAGKIVELGVGDDDFAKTQTDTMQTAIPSVVTEGSAAVAPAESPAPAAESGGTPKSPEVAAAKPAEPKPAEVHPAATAASNVYAQLLSTGDQKTAEALATRVINGGYTSAYVERGTGEKGTIFRVRVRFNTEAEAHAAEAKLREFSKDVWITKAP